MKSSLLILLIVMAALVLTPVMANAQTEQTASTSPPLSQPLVREGTLATKLAEALKVGPATNETEAESALSAAGIAPKNGWVADYPVTPDIAAELQTSVSDAATAGRIPVSKGDSSQAFLDVMTGLSLPVTPGISDVTANNASAPAYPESDVASNYYYDEGPPVVTYYAPPPDYAYLYSWVPYPFWWWNFWFPGFFVLVDFDGHGHGHHDGHGHGHDGHGHGDKEFVSNHFRDPQTGRMSRIDPANRVNGGTFADRSGSTGWTSASARSGAQSIVANNRVSTATSGSRIGALPRTNGVSGIRNQTATSSVRSASTVRTASPRTYGSSSLSNPRSRSYANSTRQSFAPTSVQNRTFSRPSYRTTGNFSTPMGGRSFSSPSAGSRLGGNSFSGMRSSFSGGTRSSFSGGIGGGSFGGRSSFGGGGFRR